MGSNDFWLQPNNRRFNLEASKDGINIDDASKKLNISKNQLSSIFSQADINQNGVIEDTAEGENELENFLAAVNKKFTKFVGNWEKKAQEVAYDDARGNSVREEYDDNGNIVRKVVVYNNYVLQNTDRKSIEYTYKDGYLTELIEKEGENEKQTTFGYTMGKLSKTVTSEGITQTTKFYTDGQESEVIVTQDGITVEKTYKKSNGDTVHLLLDGENIIENIITKDNTNITVVYKGDFAGYESGNLNKIYERVMNFSITGEGESAVPQITSYEAEYDGQGNTIVYAAAGDGWERLAKQFNTTVSELKRLNIKTAKTDNIQAAQPIIVPGIIPADSEILNGRREIDRAQSVHDAAMVEYQKSENNIKTSYIIERELPKDFDNAYQYAEYLVTHGYVPLPEESNFNACVNTVANELRLLNGDDPQSYKKGKKVNVIFKRTQKVEQSLLEVYGLKPNEENAVFFTRYAGLSNKERAEVMDALEYCRKNKITDKARMNKEIQRLCNGLNMFDTDVKTLTRPSDIQIRKVMAQAVLQQLMQIMAMYDSVNPNKGWSSGFDLVGAGFIEINASLKHWLQEPLLPDAEAGSDIQKELRNKMELCLKLIGICDREEAYQRQSVEYKSTHGTKHFQQEFEQIYKSLTGQAKIDYDGVANYLQISSEMHRMLPQQRTDVDGVTGAAVPVDAEKYKELEQELQKYQNSINAPILGNFAERIQEWAQNCQQIGGLTEFATTLVMMYVTGGFAAIGRGSAAVGSYMERGFAMSMENMATTTLGRQVLSKDVQFVLSKSIGIQAQLLTNSALTATAFNISKFCQSASDFYIDEQEWTQMCENWKGLAEFTYVNGLFIGPATQFVAKSVTGLAHTERAAQAILNNAVGKSTTFGSLMTTVLENAGNIEKGIQMPLSFAMNMEYMAKADNLTYEEAFNSLLHMEGISKLIAGLMGQKGITIPPEKVKTVSARVMEYKVDIARFDREVEGKRKPELLIRVTSPEGEIIGEFKDFEAFKSRMNEIVEAEVKRVAIQPEKIETQQFDTKTEYTQQEIRENIENLQQDAAEHNRTCLYLMEICQHEKYGIKTYEDLINSELVTPEERDMIERIYANAAKNGYKEFLDSNIDVLIGFSSEYENINGQLHSRYENMTPEQLSVIKYAKDQLNQGLIEDKYIEAIRDRIDMSVPSEVYKYVDCPEQLPDKVQSVHDAQMSWTREQCLEMIKNVKLLREFIETQSIPSDITVTRIQGYNIMKNVKIGETNLADIMQKAEENGNVAEVIELLNSGNITVYHENHIGTSMTSNPVVSGEHHHIKWEINVPKGSKGLFLESAVPEGGIYREVEFLIQMGSGFKIKSAEYKDGMWHIKVDLVQGEEYAGKEVLSQKAKVGEQDKVGPGENPAPIAAEKVKKQWLGTDLNVPAAEEKVDLFNLDQEAGLKETPEIRENEVTSLIFRGQLEEALAMKYDALADVLSNFAVNHSLEISILYESCKGDTEMFANEFLKMLSKEYGDAEYRPEIVTFDEDGKKTGGFNFITNQIRVKKNMSKDDLCKTLIHEYTHAIQFLDVMKEEGIQGVTDMIKNDPKIPENMKNIALTEVLNNKYYKYLISRSNTSKPAQGSADDYLTRVYKDEFTNPQKTEEYLSQLTELEAFFFENNNVLLKALSTFDNMHKIQDGADDISNKTISQEELKNIPSDIKNITKDAEFKTIFQEEIKVIELNPELFVDLKIVTTQTPMTVKVLLKAIDMLKKNLPRTYEYIRQKFLDHLVDTESSAVDFSAVEKNRLFDWFKTDKKDNVSAAEVQEAGTLPENRPVRSINPAYTKENRPLQQREYIKEGQIKTQEEWDALLNDIASNLDESAQKFFWQTVDRCGYRTFTKFSVKFLNERLNYFVRDALMSSTNYSSWVMDGMPKFEAWDADYNKSDFKRIFLYNDGTTYASEMRGEAPVKPETQEEINHLFRIISESKPLEKPMTTYRVVREYPGFIEQLVEGGTIRDDAFISSSSEYGSFLDYWNSARSTEESFVLRITLPEGTKVLNCNGTYKPIFGKTKYMRYGGTKEYDLAPSELKIKKIDWEHNVIDVEYVIPEWMEKGIEPSYPENTGVRLNSDSVQPDVKASDLPIQTESLAETKPFVPGPQVSEWLIKLQKAVNTGVLNTNGKQITLTKDAQAIIQNAINMVNEGKISENVIRALMSRKSEGLWEDAIQDISQGTSKEDIYKKVEQEYAEVSEQEAMYDLYNNYGIEETSGNAKQILIQKRYESRLQLIEDIKVFNDFMSENKNAAPLSVVRYETGTTAVNSIMIQGKSLADWLKECEAANDYSALCEAINKENPSYTFDWMAGTSLDKNFDNFKKSRIFKWNITAEVGDARGMYTDIIRADQYSDEVEWLMAKGTKVKIERAWVDENGLLNIDAKIEKEAGISDIKQEVNEGVNEGVSYAETTEFQNLEKAQAKLKQDNVSYEIITDKNGNKLIRIVSSYNMDAVKGMTDIKYKVLVFDKDGKCIKQEKDIPSKEVEKQYSDFHSRGAKIDIIDNSKSNTSAPVYSTILPVPSVLKKYYQSIKDKFSSFMGGGDELKYNPAKNIDELVKQDASTPELESIKKTDIQNDMNIIIKRRKLNSDEVKELSEYLRKYSGYEDKIIALLKNNENMKLNHIDQYIDLINKNKDLQNEISYFFEIQRYHKKDLSDPFSETESYLQLLKNQNTDKDFLLKLVKNPNINMSDINWILTTCRKNPKLKDAIRRLSGKKYSLDTIKSKLKTIEEYPNLSSIILEPNPRYKLIDTTPSKIAPEIREKRKQLADYLRNNFTKEFNNLKTTLGEDFFINVKWEEIVPEKATDNDIKSLLVTLNEKCKFFTRLGTNERRFGKDIQYAHAMYVTTLSAAEKIKAGEDFNNVIQYIATDYRGYDGKLYVGSFKTEKFDEERLYQSGKYRGLDRDMEISNYISKLKGRDDDLFGIDYSHTPFNATGGYGEYYDRFVTQIGKREETNLTKIVYEGNDANGNPCFAMIHPSDLTVNSSMKKINKNFKSLRPLVKKVKKGQNLTDEEIKQTHNIIAEMYFRMANTMPFERGSNGISDVFMRSCYKSLGIEMPALRKNVSLDLEAFCTDMDEYKKNWLNFFEQ